MRSAIRNATMRRWMILSGCVVVTLAVLDQARPNAAPESRTPRQIGRDPEAVTSVNRPLELPAHRAPPPLRSNPFAPRAEPSPPPAAPAPQVEAPAPGPQVPPVPYRFAGKVVYDG